MGRKKRKSTSITIADVAREAGVAPMTVSRALNGHPSVRPGTMLKVRDAAERLSYQPNHAARVLMGQPSNSIALVLPELKNPFFAVVADGVQAAARERGVLVWVVSSNNDVRIEQSEIEKLFSYKVDGILLISSDPSHSYLKGLVAGKTPVVAIDIPLKSAVTDSIVVENREGSRQAVEHLIGHGYKKILCVAAWPGLYTMQERIAGYKEAMENVGLTPEVLTDAFDIASTRKAIERLARGKGRQGAIFSLNQLTTEIVLKLVDEMQISIPEQMALIGFDDFFFASLLRPRLTVVRQPAAEMGRSAALALFERIDAKDQAVKRKILLPTELIIRESCGCEVPMSDHGKQTADG